VPNIIRNFNSPKEAVTLNGNHVYREQNIYLPSHRAVLPVLQTSMHFCFRDASNPRGSTLFCTCGAAGVVVGFDAYKKYQSYIGHEVIACHSFIMYGVHSDGSHE